MEVRQGFPRDRGYGKVVLTLGFYDGVHRGHQKIIKEVIQEAKRRGAKSCLVTFRPHPSEFFHGRPLSLLTTWEEKKEIFKRLDLDLVVALQFTTHLASLSPKSFLEKLRGSLRFEELIVGKDFVFGHQRQGNTEWLEENQSRFGFKLRIVPLLKVGGEKLSSSLIRRWLKMGEIEKVTRGLGRYPTIIGEVIGGRKRGRLLGYPTANLAPHPEKLLPPSGVYAGRVNLKGKFYKGMINVGTRPTFEDSSFGVEVHVLKFGGDIYGDRVKIELVSKIRAPAKFISANQLSKKLKEDSIRTERILDGLDFSRGGFRVS
jgi:riboflavin kinase/FMN adenylyltransferase